jgi:hypothetical protein
VETAGPDIGSSFVGQPEKIEENNVLPLEERKLQK